MYHATANSRRRRKPSDYRTESEQDEAQDGSLNRAEERVTEPLSAEMKESNNTLWYDGSARYHSDPNGSDNSGTDEEMESEGEPLAAASNQFLSETDSESNSDSSSADEQHEPEERKRLSVDTHSKPLQHHPGMLSATTPGGRVRGRLSTSHSTLSTLPGVGLQEAMDVEEEEEEEVDEPHAPRRSLGEDPDNDSDAQQDSEATDHAGPHKRKFSESDPSGSVNVSENKDESAVPPVKRRRGRPPRTAYLQNHPNSNQSSPKAGATTSTASTPAGNTATATSKRRGGRPPLPSTIIARQKAAAAAAAAAQAEEEAATSVPQKEEAVDSSSSEEEVNAAAADEEEDNAVDSGLTAEEQEEKLRQAMDSMQQFEKEFADLKQRLYDEQCIAIQKEYEALENGTHPEFINRLAQNEESHSRNIRVTAVWLEQEVQAILNRYDAEVLSADQTFESQLRAIQRRLYKQVEKKRRKIESEWVENVPRSLDLEAFIDGAVFDVAAANAAMEDDNAPPQFRGDFAIQVEDQELAEDLAYITLKKPLPRSTEKPKVDDIAKSNVESMTRESPSKSAPVRASSAAVGNEMEPLKMPPVTTPMLHATKSTIPLTPVQIVENQLIIGNETLGIDSPVEIDKDPVFGRYQGKITSLNNQEIWIRRADQTQSKIFLSQLRQGPITMKSIQDDADVHL